MHEASRSCSGLEDDSCHVLQVEEELRAERAQAEAEELRAKQAIEQKQQELQQIESAREQEAS